MTQRTYKINSELEFQRLASTLDELGIPFSFRKYSDISFPLLGQVNAFADISISFENAPEVESLIKEFTNNEPQKTQSQSISKNRNGIGTTLLIAYSIIATILLLRYWYVSVKNSSDKNNTLEWSYDAQELTYKNKKTKVISSLSIDANYDLNFEQFIIYSNEGVKICESRDFNEDGIYEQTFLYNLKGQLTGALFDTNNDGVQEDIQIILENKDTLKLFDTNSNGFLEKK